MARRGPRPKKLSRQENAAQLHQALIESAITSAGLFGFSQSSVSRITGAAGVAQGTLYSYFGSHQLLLDQLLPIEGARLLAALGENESERLGFFEEERRRLGLLLRFLEERPYILRLLIEAEVATPDSFFHYMGEIGRRYTIVMKAAQQRGEIRRVSAREMQVIAETLAGCRAHVGIYLLQQQESDPEGVERYEANAMAAYVKFLRHGVGQSGEPRIAVGRGRRAVPRRSSVPEAGRDMRTMIFETAGPGVAAAGFGDILVKDIATRARVSIGTFYAHFASRDEFLSGLLLHVRRDVARRIADATANGESFVDVEIRSFKALFEIIQQKPWLTKLAAEAAMWKAAEYQHHFVVISRHYRIQMAAAKARGELEQYSAGEIDVLSVIFTAARRFLGTRFTTHSGDVLPSWVAKAYIMLVAQGLSADSHA